MRRIAIKVLIIMAGFLVGPAAFAATTIDTQTIQEFKVIMPSIEDALNSGNYYVITDSIGSDQTVLHQNVVQALDSVNISQFSMICDDPIAQENDNIKVECRYSLDALSENGSFSVSGLKMYFVFEKSADGYWYIIDTDLPSKVSAEAFGEVMKIVLKSLLFSMLALLPMLIFTIWMIVDAVKRKQQNLAVWILVMIFFMPIGSLIYFFGSRRKAIKAAGQSNTKGLLICGGLFLLTIAGFTASAIVTYNIIKG